jgi:hypothetical protein
MELFPLCDLNKFVHTIGRTQVFIADDYDDTIAWPNPFHEGDCLIQSSFV